MSDNGKFSREHVITNGKAIFYAIIWPDIMAAAMEKGWALGLHGSLQSDMDIMAMPWTEKASSPDEMIESIRGVFTDPIGGIEFDTKKHLDKPNSRVVYTIPIWADLYLDINIIEPPMNVEVNIVRCTICGKPISSHESAQTIDGKYFCQKHMAKEKVPIPPSYCIHLQGPIYIKEGTKYCGICDRPKRIIITSL